MKDPNISRRRPRFEPGFAGIEAAKLKKFSARVLKDAASLGWGGDGLKDCGYPTLEDWGLSSGIGIYRNNLKNREFDKEDPQNFCSEQAPSGFPADVSSEGVRAIAEWLRKHEESPEDFRNAEQVSEGELAGASENENYEVNLTPPKTDSSGCFGINELTLKAYFLCQK